MHLTFDQRKAFINDGYIILPGVVPAHAIHHALKEINRRIGAGEHSENSKHPAITDLFNATPVKRIVESLVGDDGFFPITSGQTAVRFPVDTDPLPTAHAHLDGMLELANGIVRNFTALVGVFLSDVPAAGAGNFTVWPGSHRKYETYFKEQGGPDVLLTEEAFRTLHRSPNVEIGESVPLVARAGDVVICHYQLIHAAGPNGWHNPRYACFFRVDHKERGNNWRAPLTDLWLHYPGLQADLERA